MKVRIEDAGGCRRVMHVDVPVDATEPEYQRVVKAFAAQAKIPGFRKGKAPEDVAEKRFSGQIQEEARDRLVPTFYNAALEQEGVKPVAIVSVQDVSFDKQKGLQFQVTLDVPPQFKVPKYHKLVVRSESADVADADVDATLTRLLESAARFEDVEGRAVKEGDLVRIDYDGVCEGQPVAGLATESAGVGTGKDFWMMVGEPEFLPGFPAGIVGAEIDETREVKITFPAAYQVEPVRGKEAVYTVLIKAIRERIIPELDEELLKRFDVESEAALRDRIRQDLEEGAVSREEARRKDNVARQLLDKASVDLPQSLIERETNQVIQETVQRLTMQGGTREQLESQRDEIVKVASETAASRVKLTYILDAIAKKEGITVADDEVDTRIQMLAEQQRSTPERLRPELEKRDMMGQLRDDVRSDKTLNFLLQHAKIKK